MMACWRSDTYNILVCSAQYCAYIACLWMQLSYGLPTTFNWLLRLKKGLLGHADNICIAPYSEATQRARMMSVIEVHNQHEDVTTPFYI